MAKGQELPFRSTLDDSQFEAGMRRMEATGKRVAGNVTGHLKGLISPIATIGPAIAGAFTGKAIISGVTQVFEAGRALNVLSRQTGVSVAGLVILQSKFKQAGLDVSLAAQSIFRLQKSINGVEDDENKGGLGRLAKLGLNLAALKKLTPDRQFFAVGQAISAITDPAERTAAAMQIFGRTGAELNAVFSKPGFAQISSGLQQKAQMMATNAGIFEQISLKLERVSGLAKPFYVGVADRVATSLDPLLSRLEGVNLVGIGQKFGDALAFGAGKVIDMLKALDDSPISKGATARAVAAPKDPEQDANDKAARAKGYSSTDIAVNHAINKVLGVFVPRPEVVMPKNSAVKDLRFDTGVSSLNHRAVTLPGSLRPLTLPSPLSPEHMGMMAAMRHFNYDRPLSAPSTPYSAAELEQMRLEERERTLAAQKAAAGGSAPDRIVISASEEQIGPAMDRYNAAFRSSHRMGIAGLDYDPTTRPGYTGAKWGQEGFRHGLSVGGSYGHTGHIYAQMNRHGHGSDQDHARATAQHTKEIRDVLKKGLETKGSGGSGGGATVTG